MSLLEVMVAASVLIIVLTSAASSLAMGFDFIAARRLQATAESVASSHMETLLATERDRILVASDCDPVPYNREVIVGTTQFTASCSIDVDKPAVSARYARLTVTVRWNHNGGHSTSFATYIENRVEEP